MLGGSSALNGMAYNRGNKQNFDYWSKMGNKGWDYDNLLKYMKLAEGNQDPEIAKYKKGYYHNQHGPVNISLFSYKDRMSRIFLDAATETNNEQILDINADKTLGYLYFQGFVYDGVRQSAAKSYLIPAKNRPNLCIVKNAHVYKVLFDDNKRAIGVEYDYKGVKNVTAYASREVILSAGAIESAKLLLLSGIGPKLQLNRFDIPTISDLPVGENLIDHLNVGKCTYNISAHIFGVIRFYCVFFFSLSPPALLCEFDEKFTSPTQSLDDTFDYFIHRRGPLSSSGIVFGGFENSEKNVQNKNPDFQALYRFVNRNSSGLKRYGPFVRRKIRFQINQKSDVGLVRVKILQPKSVGYVRLRSAFYKDAPFINANYFANSNDIETMLRAIKSQIKFESTKSFKKHKGKFIKLPLTKCDEFKYKSDAYWKCYMRYMCGPASDIVGRKFGFSSLFLNPIYLKLLLWYL